ncbi:SNARE-associated protein Snapin isoform X1 [Macrotis lagotis]|uniref:SNARE-associated protein Snapin isoform X1 n=1 Tax=Macrotis lagotis TaxID=92651 RepID=UPI003D6969AC
MERSGQSPGRGAGRARLCGLGQDTPPHRPVKTKTTNSPAACPGPFSIQRLHFPEAPAPRTQTAPPRGRRLSRRCRRLPAAPARRSGGAEGRTWPGPTPPPCPGPARRWPAPRAGTCSPKGCWSSCVRPCSSWTLTCTRSELCRINEDQKVALDLDPYVKKLLNARRRVVLVNNILQNAQERLRRLNHSVAKETVRRRAMLESGGYPSGSPRK